MIPDAQLLLVYLSAYHLGDPLFLSSLARDVKAHVGPIIFLHGSGEAAARMLEARGLFSEAQRRTKVAKQWVEQATRNLNRQIVHEINEAGAPAVGVLGVDRGLLHRSESGEIQVGRIEWILDLAHKGAIPVVGGLIRASQDNLEAADPAQMVVAIASATQKHNGVEPVVVAFTIDRKAGLIDAKSQVQIANLEPTHSLPSVADAGVIREIAQTVRVRLTTPRALRGEGLPGGTDLVGRGV